MKNVIINPMRASAKLSLYKEIQGMALATIWSVVLNSLQNFWKAHGKKGFCDLCVLDLFEI